MATPPSAWPANHPELRPLASLKPRITNPLNHPPEQVAQIAASIRQWGWTNPVLIEDDGTIIAGHGRVLAARTLTGTNAIEQVPCLVARGWTPAQVRAYVIADNKLPENAEWNQDLLKAELAALQLEEFDLELLGFEAGEIEDLLGPGDGGGGGEEDSLPTPQQVARTRPGDVWVMGRHRLVCGDACAEESWAALGPLAKAVTFTSPPYGAGNVARIRQHYVQGRRAPRSFYVNHKDDAEMWLALMEGWTREALARTDLVVANVQMLADNKRDFLRWWVGNVDHLVDVLVWDKLSGPPQMQANVLTNRFEFVVLLAKEKNPSRAIPFAQFHGDKSNLVPLSPSGQNENHEIHKAAMPVKFAEWFIKLLPDAVVFVDPFAGTGTTIIAAERLGRAARGIEIDPIYCDLIVERWQKSTGMRAMRESDGVLFADALTNDTGTTANAHTPATA